MDGDIISNTKISRINGLPCFLNYGASRARPWCMDLCYNGHKRVHAKFQPIALPNGMIGNMFGPVGK